MSIAEKVVLTKEQAELIEHVKEMYHRKDAILIQSNRGWSGEEAPLNKLNFDDFIRALYIGYEVKKTPEEHVRDYYNCLKGKHAELNQFSKSSFQSEMTGVRTTLELLNIKIEGVNA